MLTRPAYRRLWAARTVSQAGDVAQFTTLALLVLHLTASGLGVSVAVAVEIAPVVLFAPLAGALADRLPGVTVMVAADVARWRWRWRWPSGMTTSGRCMRSHSACPPDQHSSVPRPGRCCPPWSTRTMRLASLLGGGLLADTVGIRAVYYTGAGLLLAAATAGGAATRCARR